MFNRIKTLRTRPLIVALLIGLAAQALFMIDLGKPGKLVFDEIHYVPAALSLLALEGPRNVEHPMLGKELIALGIALFGDNPFGWRIIPTIAGSATVMGAFAFMWFLLGKMRPAIIGAALVTLNQTLFVQARTSMLDVFLGAFMIWGLALLLWAIRRQGRTVWTGWIAGAACLGLAVASKWAAIPYVAFIGAAFLWIRFRDTRNAKRPIAEMLSGKDQPHWRDLPTIPALLLLGGVSIAVYLATFAPAFFYAEDAIDFAGLFALQWEMYALQKIVLPYHTYQSEWWGWPLLLRPIWFFYEPDDGVQRGVLLIGNPVIMWGGLLAILACYWAWFKERAARPLAVALLWTASIAIFAIIPKSLGFYYYYHLSGIFICLAIAVALDHFDRGKNRGIDEWVLAASTIMFIYFYPILAGSALEGPDSFHHWAWFRSWA